MTEQPTQHPGAAKNSRSLAWAWVGLALALVWAVARSGVAVTPALGDIYRAIEAWPARLDGEFLAFYTDSPLGVLPFRALGLDDETGLLRLTSVVVLLGIAGYALVAAWWVQPAERMRAARLAILAPLPAVLLAWLGSYDAFTIAAWLVCLVAWHSGRLWLMFMAGALLGFQHFEHGLLGVTALTLAWLATRAHLPGSLASRSPLWLALGVLGGKALLTLVLVTSGSGASGRTQWLAPYLREWTVTAINTGPVLLWSLFAGTWAVVAALWLTSLGRSERLLLIGAIGIGLLALALSGDRPRVFAIVMAPSVLLMIVALLRSGRASPTVLRVVETVVWVGVPLSLWGSEIVGAGALDQLIMTWGQLAGG